MGRHTHGKIRNAYMILIVKTEVNVVVMVINLRIGQVTYYLISTNITFVNVYALNIEVTSLQLQY